MKREKFILETYSSKKYALIFVNLNENILNFCIKKSLLKLSDSTQSKTPIIHWGDDNWSMYRPFVPNYFTVPEPKKIMKFKYATLSTYFLGTKKEFLKFEDMYNKEIHSKEYNERLKDIIK